MKRYLRGWIYNEILHGKKLLILGSFILFYLGLAFSPLDQNPLQKSHESKKSIKVCFDENQTIDWLKTE